MASYAAAIREALDVEPAIVTGVRGQFDVLVDGRTVVSRKGGLFAMIMRKPWPSMLEVVKAVRMAE